MHPETIVFAGTVGAIILFATVIQVGRLEREFKAAKARDRDMRDQIALLEREIRAAEQDIRHAANSVGFPVCYQGVPSTFPAATVALRKDKPNA